MGNHAEQSMQHELKRCFVASAATPPHLNGYALSHAVRAVLRLDEAARVPVQLRKHNHVGLRHRDARARSGDGQQRSAATRILSEAGDQIQINLIQIMQVV